MIESLAELLTELKENEVITQVKNRLDSGDNPLLLIEELREGMRAVGERFEEGSYYLSEMLLAADILQTAMTNIKPCLPKQSKTLGVIVIGTVKGDIHTIGKDIVASLLECEGFTVHNIGVDIDAAQFVKEVQEKQADILGLSTLLTSGIPVMKATIEELKKAGLRDKIKVLIGGPLFNDPALWQTEIGADAAVGDAVEGVKVAKKLIGVESQ